MTSPQVTAKIIYSKPGTQPPVYLAGTFSEPEWDPIELEYTTEGEEHQFYKEVQVQENEQYQYKFRIGSGDWWVLNEDAPTGMHGQRSQGSSSIYLATKMLQYLYDFP